MKCNQFAVSLQEVAEQCKDQAVPADPLDVDNQLMTENLTCTPASNRSVSQYGAIPNGNAANEGLYK